MSTYKLSLLLTAQSQFASSVSSECKFVLDDQPADSDLFIVAQPDFSLGLT